MQENAAGNRRWEGGISEQQHRYWFGNQGNLGQHYQQESHTAKNACYIPLKSCLCSH